jgi:ABC-type Co2+ transport system permease subunit
MNTRAFWLSTLIAGAAIAVFGNLPVLNLINCAICVWVWLGGALSVFLYRRFQGSQSVVSAGQAAGLGALSGLIGAVLGAGVFLITSPLSVPMFNALTRVLQVENQFNFQNGLLENISEALIFLVIDLILYPVFGALGAIIAAAYIRKARTEMQTAS